MNKEDALSIMADLDDSVDAFLLDIDIGIGEVGIQKDLYYYKDKKLIGTVVSSYVNTISKGLIPPICVYMDVEDEIAQYVKLDEGTEIVTKPDIADIIIAGKNKYSIDELKGFTQLKWFVATKNGLVNVTKENEMVKFIRIDMTFQVVYELIKQLNYQGIIFNRYGQKRIGEINYCSGGFIGIKNSIVVDDIHNIRYKYGVANGDGSIDYFENQK